jgi:hypothetical protein
VACQSDDLAGGVFSGRFTERGAVGSEEQEASVAACG